MLGISLSELFWSGVQDVIEEYQKQIPLGWTCCRVHIQVNLCNFLVIQDDTEMSEIKNIMKVPCDKRCGKHQ